ncbi:MAG: flavodoxin family protein [Deltaproteobacteria bacterium]|jgi:multimeric flavodoxin WrbA|nr:flavodoxin family protein [Deltaproteobacteria bacterium]
MKVVAVLGSPRAKSASTRLADKVVETLQGDKEYVKFSLNNLKVRGCQGCGSCKGKTEICVLTDELIRVLAEVANSDILIFTSPIYIGEITSQGKIFVDRAYSYYKPDFITNPSPSRLSAGKKALLIFTQGNPDAQTYLESVHKNYLGYFSSLGFKTASHAAVMPFSPAEENSAIEAEGKKAAEKLAAL